MKRRSAVLLVLIVLAVAAATLHRLGRTKAADFVLVPAQHQAPMMEMLELAPAVSRARTEKRPLFLFFTADW